MIRREIKHLVADTDRHGTVRYYVRVRGAKKVRLRADPDSPDFLAEYAAALARVMAEAKGEQARRREGKGSIGWLIERYLAGDAFAALDEGTQARRRKILADFRAAHGEKPAATLRPRTLRRILAAWKTAHGPHGANNRLKGLRGLYRWAVDDELVEVDPTRDVRPFSPRSDGFHTWTPDEIRKFMRRWPLGTAPRVAMTVMLATGFRVSDAFQVGPQHVQTGRIVYTPGKTRQASGVTVDIPLLPILREALEAGPTGPENFVVGVRGRPFSSGKSLSESFKRWCREAGLGHVSAHGLRKGGATILAERGATASQLMAIYGWVKLEQAERYTRKASRRKMADALSDGLVIDEKEDDAG